MKFALDKASRGFLSLAPAGYPECELEDNGEFSPVNRKRGGESRVYLKTQRRLFGLGSLLFIRTAETQTTARNDVQSLVQQQLTAPADTANFTTPTLTFGEVGETGRQMTSGYDSKAHGVGHFFDTRLLERMAFLHTQEWAVTDTGQLHFMDVLDALKSVPRNAAILQQFQYMRADIELTFRLNTNQFYYGALMLTMWPNVSAGSASLTTGNLVDERAVLDPTIVSASSAQSVVKNWSYCFPFPWISTQAFLTDSSPYKSVPFSIDILAPLTRASETMPDSVTIQLWARFKNIELSYPTGPATVLRPQSGGAMTFQIVPVKDKSVPKAKSRTSGQKPRKFPEDDPTAKSSTGAKKTGTEKVLQAFESVSVVDAVGAVGDAAAWIWDKAAGVLSSAMNLGAMFMFDKPDREVVQTPVINEPSIDMYSVEMPDSNPVISMYSGRYVDPDVSRMPMSKNWTVGDYARIPGLRVPAVLITPTFVPISIMLGTQPSNLYRTPLDFANLSSSLSRGSIKVCLQFFTSAFISARVLVQLTRLGDALPSDYTNGLSRIINVKGDTVDCFVAPWLSDRWWEAGFAQTLTLSLESDIATTDNVVDPVIYCVVWIAGGDDVQFAFPRVPNYAVEWGSPTVFVPELEEEDRVPVRHPLSFVPQAGVGAIFQSESFAPIVENTVYDIDQGYCTSEQLGFVSDVTKRYSAMLGVPASTVCMDAYTLDALTPVTLLASSFRNTFFGSWRSAFLCRSGGYKWRFFATSPEVVVFGTTTTFDNDSTRESVGTTYVMPEEGVARLTVPQLMLTPFAMLGWQAQALNVTAPTTVTQASGTAYIAARDDIQFGYPILPRRYSSSE